VKSRHFLVALSFALLWVLVACGGGGSGGGSGNGSGSGSGGGTTGTLMSPDERAAAMADAITQFKLIDSESRADEDSFVTYLKSHPSFLDAGYAEATDNVWATFKDGVPVVFCDNLKPPENPAPLPTAIPPSKTRAADAVPFNQQYRILYSLGNVFQNNSGVVASMLEDAGYKASSTMSAQIPALMTTVHDDGFFMWSTHCGVYKREVSENVTEDAFGMSTSTYWTKASESKEPYKTLLANGSIGVSWGVENKAVGGETADENTFVKDGHTVRGYYMVNPPFIKKYFKFKANSLVILNACTSFDPLITGAFGAAGASTVVGWSKPTGNFAAISGRLVDLLCGGNKFEPKQDPPQRPFDIDRVFQWLEVNDLVSYPSTIDGVPVIVQMGYVPLAGRFGPLAPSIRSFTITEGLYAPSKSYIHIKGIFGPKDGGLYARQVFVNGNALTIIGGDDTTIDAEIPSTGAASFGPLQVRINGRLSNTVPITMWNLKMTYDFDGPDTAFYKVNLDFKIRLDVHKFRENPGEDPIGDVVDFFSTNKSTADFTSGGTYTDTCTHTWTGSGAIADPPLGSQFFAFAGGKFDGAQQKITQFLQAAAFATSVVDNFTCPPDGHGTTSTAPGTGTNPPVTLELDDITYAILPGSGTLVAPNGTGTLTWGLTIPQSPPQTTTQS
jgi:hypothetical protein